MQLEFLVFKFTDLLVSSYHTGGTTDIEPTDQVAFNFARIEVTYRPREARRLARYASDSRLGRQGRQEDLARLEKAELE